MLVAAMIADVELDRPRLADPLDLAFLQRAQQLGLQRQRHRRDFVDEERALVRQLEPADARLHGAGERALDVAEELGLGETLGNRRGVERDEMLIVARAVVVNRPRDQLLAGAGLALDQHRAVHRRDELERREDAAHRRAAADDVVEAEAVWSWARSSAFSCRSCRCSMPARSTRESCASWNGLIRKSMAPRLIAVTASFDAAEAGDDDGADAREERERLVEDVHAVGVGQPQVDDQGVVGEAAQPLDARRRRRAPGRRRTRRPRGLRRSLGGGPARLRRRARKGADRSTSVRSYLLLCTPSESGRAGPSVEEAAGRHSQVRPMCRPNDAQPCSRPIQVRPGRADDRSLNAVARRHDDN